MIKNNLKELMLQHGKNLSQVAKETGISRISIASIRDNRTQGLSYKTIDAICRCFKCGVDDLLKILE